MRDDFFENLRQPCPVEPGTRIEFLGHGGHEPDPLVLGELGTVTGGNGAQINVQWDSGRSLMLLVGTDRWRVVT